MCSKREILKLVGIEKLIEWNYIIILCMSFTFIFVLHLMCMQFTNRSIFVYTIKSISILYSSRSNSLYSAWVKNFINNRWIAVNEYIGCLLFSTFQMTFITFTLPWSKILFPLIWSFNGNIYRLDKYINLHIYIYKLGTYPIK